MKKLSIQDFNTNFRSNRDIETALAWNALKKYLEENNQSRVFASVKSIKVGEKNITISTKKSIINQELTMMKEGLIRSFEAAIKPLRDFKCEKIYFN